MQADSSEVMVAERKRRLTAPESPGRRSGPVHNGASSSAARAADTRSGSPGSSRNNAIDLTADDERPLPPPPNSPPHPHPTILRRTSRPTVPTVARRQSDIVLPKWQSDSDVSVCPVCSNQFTFWYRKHHCRKCGRVVCANCSPHRITIPRQFIVRPPEPLNALLDITGDTSPTTPTTPQQLWGGEEVRVCNPCVPDPNLSPPPQPQVQRSPDRIPPENWRFPSETPIPHLRHPPGRLRNSSGPLPPLPPLPPHARHRPALSDVSLLATDHGRRLAQGPFLTHRGAFPVHNTARDLYTPPSISNSTYYPPRTSSAAPPATVGSLPTHTSSRTPHHYRSMLDVEGPRLVPQAPPPPRRQIAEEDECPICSEELPPKGPNGETDAREHHVDECIASHLYTSTSPSRTASAPPDASASVETGTSPSVSASSVSEAGQVAGSPSTTTTTPAAVAAGSSSTAAPLRQRRMTGGRMLVYRATEKDCVGEDGAEAECVICFEEFEPGDEMGRLECLCRFHRTCIRQWWDTKGVGSCPTHQLHD